MRCFWWGNDCEANYIAAINACCVAHLYTINSIQQFVPPGPFASQWINEIDQFISQWTGNFIFRFQHSCLKEAADYVPSWIPNHLFWIYFAGIALIGSGIAIILKIKPG